MVSNCAIWAGWQWATKGGYLITRRSYYGWWPHFLWSPDLNEFWEYTLPDKYPHKSPPLLFHGVIKVRRRYG